MSAVGVRPDGPCWWEDGEAVARAADFFDTLEERLRRAEEAREAAAERIGWTGGLDE